MLESDLIRDILKYLRGLGCLAEKTHGGPHTRKGTADILACVRGRYVAIEAKVPGNRPTAAQEAFLADVRSAGGIGIVAYSVDDVRELYRHLDEY